MTIDTTKVSAPDDGRFHFVTMGNICFLFVVLQTKTGLTSGDKIITVPDAYKPSKALYSNASSSGLGTLRLGFSITDLSKITCTGLSGAGDWIFGTLIWVAGK